MNRHRLNSMMFALSILIAVWTYFPAEAQAVKDTPFVQKVAERYSLGSSEANDVRAIAVAPDGDVWAATRAGFYRWRKGQNRWTSVSAETAPAFAAFTDSQGNV